MSQIISRPKNTPIRNRRNITTAQLWSGPDEGLLLCWEKGREKAEQESELASRALSDELPELCWARGTWNYLAYWQGLRNDDLFIDKTAVFDRECAKTKRVFAFGGERSEREKRQIKLDAALNKLRKQAADSKHIE